MFRGVWQSCRAQSRDCRGGTRRGRVKESASPAMEKETTRKHAEEEEQNGRRTGGEGMPKLREKQTEERGTVKRKGKGTEGTGGCEEGMARWSLSVGTRATK